MGASELWCNPRVEEGKGIGNVEWWALGGSTAQLVVRGSVSGRLLGLACTRRYGTLVRHTSLDTVTLYFRHERELPSTKVAP
jgi:hypothetical protein